ncbi:MAG TPA: site-specific integrase [Acidimicrobiales bacterium]|nr:site-specific integrase [Acidimicrobiales bacterium]
MPALGDPPPGLCDGGGNVLRARHLDGERDLRHLVVAPMGTVEATSDILEPVRLLDDDGCADESGRGFVRNLVACDYSTATCRSYVLSLLRWRRFLVAVDIAWDHAERRDVRDFVLWMKGADNPQRFLRRAEGSVRLVEFTGTEQLVHVQIGAKTVRARVAAGVAIGSVVSLPVPVDRCHFFDTASGKRVS